MYGDQVDKMTQSCHLSSLSERQVGGVPVVGPIWRGGIEIIGNLSGKLDGLEVFMSKNLNSKVAKLEQSLQKSVCFRMKSRCALWPKHFDDLGAAHSDIELFMFPEVSRSEIEYDDLVEQMISNDLAMTSHIGNFKLIIFTSLEQEDNQRHIQGKYYLWGMLKGKGTLRCKSSQGKNTNAEKKRMSKSMRALDYTKKSNSPLTGRSAQSVGHQPTTTTQSAVRYDFVPLLSQGCKRARSKRGRISRMLKEAGDVHKFFLTDFPGMEQTDQESNGIMPVRWHQTLDKSRQAKICTNIEQVQVENNPDITVMKKKPGIVTDEVDNLSKKDGLFGVVGGDGMSNRAEEVTFNTEPKEAEQRSWDSTMEVDEPSDSSAINVKETEAEHCSWDSDMEVDEFIDDVVKDYVELQPQSNVSQAMDAEFKACSPPFLKSEELPVQEVPNLAIDATRASFSDKNPERILCHTVSVTNQNNSENMILRLNEDSTGDGPTVAIRMVTTGPKNHSCLIPSLHYKEGLDVHEADPPTSGENNSCLDGKPLVNPLNSVADDHKRTELKDTLPGISEISVGHCQLVARVDQLESQASDPLPEMDSCRTPEEPGPCSSSNSTLVLELDEEEDEEETAMKGTEIFNEGSDMITTTSMLNIADYFLETRSDTLRVQVGGRYTIKSDLAPILTKILIKHGDIGLGCSTMPETILGEICKAFQDLEQVSFKDLRTHHLDRLRNLCQLGEALEIDMKWLYDRCDDLEKTVLQISQYPCLKKELAQCNKSIQSLEENVDLNRSIVIKLLEENKFMEEEVESLTEHREKLQREIECGGFESRRFIGKSLLDGLF